MILPDKRLVLPGVIDINKTNPLTRGVTYLSLVSSQYPYDLVRKGFGIPAASVITQSTGALGLAADLPSGYSGAIQIASSADDIFPLDRVTVAVIRQKKDTTARASAVFGNFVDNSNRVDADVPWSDGVIYWPYGSLTGQLSISGQTFTTQPDYLIFIAGKTKGREVWRNGERIGKNSTTTSRPSNTNPVYLGGMPGALTSDNEYIYYFGVFDSEWTDEQCLSWFQNPYQVFKSQQFTYFIGEPVENIGTVQNNLDITFTFNAPTANDGDDTATVPSNLDITFTFNAPTADNGSDNFANGVVLPFEFTFFAPTAENLVPRISTFIAENSISAYDETISAHTSENKLSAYQPTYSGHTSENNLQAYSGVKASHTSENKLSIYEAFKSSHVSENNISIYKAAKISFVSQNSIAAYQAYKVDFISANAIAAFEPVISVHVSENNIKAYQPFKVSHVSENLLNAYQVAKSLFTSENALAVYKEAKSSHTSQNQISRYVEAKSTHVSENDILVYAEAFSKHTSENKIQVYVEQKSNHTSENSIVFYTVYRSVHTSENAISAYQVTRSNFTSQNTIFAFVPVKSVHISENFLDAYPQFYGYAINLETGAISKLEQFKFTSFYGNKGTREDGIFEITGTTDNGTAIQAFVETGEIDFDSTLVKRITDAYVEKDGGELKLQVNAENTDYLDYTLRAVDNSQNVKVNLAKGAKGRRHQIKISNVNGSQSTVSDIELITQDTTRR